jgi:hypothetical protein
MLVGLQSGNSANATITRIFLLKKGGREIPQLRKQTELSDPYCGSQAR